MSKLLTKNLLNLSESDYHADPCPSPSLSSSIAKILCDESPLHAWTAHPRLNPNFVREEKEHFEIGQIVHAMILEGESIAVVLDFPDWRTKDARAARDEARADGKCPILKKHFKDVEAMVQAFKVRAQAIWEELPSGIAEDTLTWQEENGVWCRMRMDWRSKDWKRIMDYKTTGSTANPDVLSRTMLDNGYDIQEAFYRRGVRKVYGIDATFRFIFQETHAPYAVSIMACGPDVQMMAEKRIFRVIETFGKCLESGVWPGYPLAPCFATLPEWRERMELEKEVREVR